ncbi:MAG: FAD-binding oxidoreductase [Gammaproteobacteria bacterium]|nr:FAD-binding oxidoreductase [Gammaproteobacteria bacterium]
MRKILIVILLLIDPVLSLAEEIALFTTDGCSAFPDGTIHQQTLWLDCCIKHDLAYWAGGTYDERRQADQTLNSCVTRAGEPEIARLMLAGVRVGGSPYFPTSYRWGYGWSYPRGYQLLSEQERTDINNKLQLFMKMVVSISDEISSSKLTSNK